MQFHQEALAAANLLRQVIPELVRRKIPTTPVNFALWYASFAEDDPQLRQELEQHFSEPGCHRFEVSDELFDRFVINPRSLNPTVGQQQTLTMLMEAMRCVGKNLEGNRAYSAALEQGIHCLQSSTDPQDVQDTLASLLSETTKARELNADFQLQLEESHRNIESLHCQLAKTEADAFTDPLTGIGNRRHLDRSLQQCLREHDGNLCLLLVDMDHFKRINDQFGHAYGDVVLKAAATSLKEFEDENLYVARFGDDEFAMVLPQHTLPQALVLADQVRRRITALDVEAENGKRLDQLSGSIGAARHISGESGEQLLQRAGAAVSEAKNFGRNQVSAA